MADRGRPIPIGAAIYASAHKAVQPPDDRTYSAEVTVFQRNLPHHRSARAVSPYTRSDIIPPQLQIVKKNFRENHKVCALFSYNLRAAGRQANACTGLLYSLRHWACSVSLPLNHRRAAGRPYAHTHHTAYFTRPANQLRLFDNAVLSRSKAFPFGEGFVSYIPLLLRKIDQHIFFLKFCMARCKKTAIWDYG